MTKPKLPPGQKAETRPLRFPPAAYKRIEAQAIEAGFVTSTGRPKVAAYLMHKAGVTA